MNRAKSYFYPIGPGETRDGPEFARGGGWTDERHFYYTAFRPNQPPQAILDGFQDGHLEGKPVFLAPPGFTVVTLPANAHTVCRDSGRAYYFCSANTPPKALAGVGLNDLLLAVSRDGRSVFVSPPPSSALDAPLERVDVATGRRQPWLNLKPPDTSGLVSIRTATISLDGDAYFYSTRRMYTELFVVEGLR